MLIHIYPPSFRKSAHCNHTLSSSLCIISNALDGLVSYCCSIIGLIEQNNFLHIEMYGYGGLVTIKSTEFVSSSFMFCELPNMIVCLVINISHRFVSVSYPKIKYTIERYNIFPCVECCFLLYKYHRRMKKLVSDQTFF